MDPLLIFMLLAVGAMFLLTSRTRKQQKQATEFRQRLEVGDEVMTGSGLFGTVIDIDGDVVTLESPSGARTDWLRAAIAKQATPPFAPEDEGEDGYDESEDLDGEPYEDEESADERGYAEADVEDELDVTPDERPDERGGAQGRLAGNGAAPRLTKPDSPRDADPGSAPPEPTTRP